MNSIETKRTKITILEIKPFSLKAERIIYKELMNWKKRFAEYKKTNDQSGMEQVRPNIQHYRKLLRKCREQAYVLRVYVKKYKTKHDIELDYDTHNHSLTTFREFLKTAENEGIREARSRLKTNPAPRSIAGKILMRMGSKKTGFTYIDPDSILKAHVAKNMSNLYSDKTPALQKKYIGIEIEFCSPMSEQALALRLFQKGIQKFAQLKTDGSLRPKDKENGYELAILLEEGSYKKGLKQVIDILDSVKAVVKDRRCGLHVHLDMRRRNKDLVYNNLVACQYALLSIVDPIRYNNEFCQVVNTRLFPQEFTGERSERYKTINAAAYYKYKTLEVRMHEGSVNYKDITNWVDLLIKLANYSKRLKNNVTRVPTLKDRLGLKKNLYKYVIERSCSWQVQNSDNIRHMREDIQALIGLRPLRLGDEIPPNRIVPNAYRDWSAVSNGIQSLLTDVETPVAVTTSYIRPLINQERVNNFEVNRRLEQQEMLDSLSLTEQSERAGEE